MEHQKVHEEANVSPAVVEGITEAADLADAAEISEQTAENILYVAKVRQENRGDDRLDLVVVFEDWATWDKYEIADHPIALVGRIEDHSEKAYYARGVYQIVMELVEDRPREDVEDEYITEILEQIDKTDTDFIDQIAASYFPKSAVKQIFTIDV